MPTSEIFLVPQDPTATTDDVIPIDDVPTNGYQFDAVMKHTESYNYFLTRHSIPGGSVITDHVVTQPLVWTMTGMLTPYSVVGVTSILGQLAREALNLPNRNIDLASFRNSTSAAVETVRAKRTQLIKFSRDHTPLTIFGNAFQFANMVIANLSIPQTPDFTDAFQVTVKFQQIRIAPQATGIKRLTSVDADKLGSKGPLEFSA